MKFNSRKGIKWIKHPTCKSVVVKTKDGKLVGRFNSFTEAEKSLVLKMNTITYAIRGLLVNKNYDFYFVD